MALEVVTLASPHLVGSSTSAHPKHKRKRKRKRKEKRECEDVHAFEQTQSFKDAIWTAGTVKVNIA